MKNITSKSSDEIVLNFNFHGICPDILKIELQRMPMLKNSRFEIF